MCLKVSSESVVCEVRRKTRRKHSSEEKILIVLEGLCGKESIAGPAVGKDESAPQVCP